MAFRSDMNFSARDAMLLWLLFLFLLLPACGGTKKKTPYPPPDILRMAKTQRHEFVQLFLQGRWCEARSMFEQSVESYLFQDDFCGAAQNHLIIWKMKQYAGISDDHHLHDANTLQRTGRQCLGLILPDAVAATPESPAALPAKDVRYRMLLEQGDFAALLIQLAKEPDQLYASVYGRKAALAAFAENMSQQAETLIQRTRELDGEQGWIIFLIEDWKIIHELTGDRNVQADILLRIEHLQGLIQPCRL